jgi:hypothetical protein
VHIVWQDLRDGTYEIYYKQSTDGGVNWGEDLRLTNAIFTSQQPSVAVSDSVVHVVWFDDREMNEEIYYKRNPTGNIVVGIENDLSGNSEQQFSIYPNPASDHFTITFTLEQPTNVNLKVRNGIGQVVATILDGKQSQGVHQIKWKIAGMPSGIYYFRLTAGNQASTGKLVLK